MNIEIERKFLLRSPNWQRLVTDRIMIRQAYLSTSGNASVRVRIKNDERATLSIKSRPHEICRLELEYDVPVLDAEAMLRLRQGSIIEKTRHLVPWQSKLWEIDVFSGDNSGLMLAEIELQQADEAFDRPDWIGAEITGIARYYNSALAVTPFSAWSRHEMASSVSA